MRKLSDYISETDAKTTWKKEYIEHCLSLSNNDLWELYGDDIQSDDWDGMYSKIQRFKANKVSVILEDRMKDCGFLVNI